MLFKTYNFYGKHANYITELTKPLAEDKPGFFKRNIDVMFAACVIGFKYNKKNDIDRSTEAKKKTILNETVLERENKPVVLFLYRLIVLLDTSVNFSTKDRLKHAYRKGLSDTSENIEEEDTYTDDPFEKLFYQYTLGGIEYLYENLIGNGKDYITNMGHIIDEISYLQYKSRIEVPDIPEKE